jgi:hypothetical protein
MRSETEPCPCINVEPALAHLTRNSLSKKADKNLSGDDLDEKTAAGFARLRKESWLPKLPRSPVSYLVN